MSKTGNLTFCFLTSLLIAAVILTTASAQPPLSIPENAGSDAASKSSRIEVRLWSTATVTDPEIRLEQIACVTGDAAEVIALKKLVLSLPFKGDNSLTLRAWEIAQRISDAGFDAARVDVIGAARCVIHTISTKLENSTQTKTIEKNRPADVITETAAPASLEGKIREMITRNLANKGLPKNSQIKIDFNPTLRELLSLTTPPYTFDIQCHQRSPVWMGLVGFKVKIYRGSELLQTVPVLAQVTVKAPVLVAARTINSKAQLTRSDVDTTLREIGNLNSRFLTNLDITGNQQAKKMIPLGSILTADMFEPLPLVKRGSLITVVYLKNGLEIKMVGKALQPGFINETIPVRNERSKEIFRAKVIGADEARVEENLAAETAKGTAPAGGRQS